MHKQIEGCRDDPYVEFTENGSKQKAQWSEGEYYIGTKLKLGNRSHM